MGTQADSCLETVSAASTGSEIRSRTPQPWQMTRLATGEIVYVYWICQCFIVSVDIDGSVWINSTSKPDSLVTWFSRTRLAVWTDAHECTWYDGSPRRWIKGDIGRNHTAEAS